MMRKLFYSLFLCVFTGTTIFAQNTTMTVSGTEYTLFELIDEVLVQGECAFVDNVTSPMNSQVNNAFPFQSYGYFQAGPNFPFEDGIVLASNGIAQIPTGGINQSGANNWVGDPDLQAFANAGGGGTVYNATVIEFEFIPFQDSFSFNYIMASDEYNTFVCTFADLFAFILSGPGIPESNFYNVDANPNTPDVEINLGGLNIATIPGTNIPVSVTNIHTVQTCGPTSQGGFAAGQFFDIPGSSPPIGTSNANSYNGQTIPLTATANVVPGQLYTIKLAISDYSDSILDSAVFIEGQSFNLDGLDLGEPITLDNPNAQCDGGVVNVDTGLPAGTDIVYEWYKAPLGQFPGDDDIIAGEENPNLDITETGTYCVFAFIPDPNNPSLPLGGCLNADCIDVEFFSQPELSNFPNRLICGEGTTTLDATPDNLALIQEQINISQQEGIELVYTWFFNDQPIEGADGPVLEVDQAGNYRVEMEFGPCSSSFESSVEIVNYMIDLGEEPEPCFDVDLEPEFEIIPEIIGVDAENLDQVQYLWSTGETTPTITVTQSGTYSLTTTLSGCEDTDSITVNFIQAHVVTVADEVICFDEGSITINSGYQINDNTDIVWTLPNGTEVSNQSNLLIDWNQMGNAETEAAVFTGDYTVTVTIGECVASDTFNFDFFRQNSSNSAQSRVIESCLIPQGISPNGDGVNDCWDLTFLTENPGIKKVQIFNRYGRTVFDQENYVNEFCGQDNGGNFLVTGTYFYVLEFLEESTSFNKVEKGWIYINREQQ